MRARHRRRCAGAVGAGCGDGSATGGSGDGSPSSAAAEVRELEQFYQRAGIHSVPAVIINDRHLISGGQPAAVFEQALRQIATQAGA